MSESKQKIQEKKATLAGATTVMVLSVVILMFGIIGLGLDPKIPLLLCTLVMMFYGLSLKISWNDMMKESFKSISSSLEAMLIIMTIGMVIGSWVSGGTVPFVIYWGLKIFSPQWVLPFTVILCAIMSTLTGSSWTTAGTVGVAFYGIATSMGIPAPVIVGAICCGAFFGDTQSPMSDGFNFAAAISGSDLYKSAKTLLCTTIPSLVISIIIFTVIGMNYSASGVGASEQILETLNGLEAGFNLNIFTLIPVVVMIVMMAKKAPAVATMISAAAAGVLVTIFVQGQSLANSLNYLVNGYVGNTGVADVDRIITRGGITGMMGTIALMFFSLWMAGVMQRTGIMEVILKAIAKVVTKLLPLTILTNVITFIMSYFAADPYLAMTLPAKALGEAYDDLGLDRSVLCRNVDNAVFFAPMVPWGSGGVYVTATLGVPTLQYIPFYFVAILAPIFCIIYAAINKFQVKASAKATNE